MYEYRKCIGGWSIDKLIDGRWIFYIKLSSKKACIDFINKEKQEAEQLKLI